MNETGSFPAAGAWAVQTVGVQILSRGVIHLKFRRKKSARIPGRSEALAPDPQLVNALHLANTSPLVIPNRARSSPDSLCYLSHSVMSQFAFVDEND